MARNGAELRTIVIVPANSQNPRTIRALPRGIRVPRIPRPGLKAARRGIVGRLYDFKRAHPYASMRLYASRCLYGDVYLVAYLCVLDDEVRTDSFMLSNSRKKSYLSDV